MTRRQILEFYKNMINNTPVNGRLIKATNYTIDVEHQWVNDSSVYPFAIIPQGETINPGLYMGNKDRRMLINIAGFVTAPEHDLNSESLFLEAEDVIDAIIEKVLDPTQYITCEFGPTNIRIVSEASPEIDFVAHVVIQVELAWVDS